MRIEAPIPRQKPYRIVFTTADRAMAFPVVVMCLSYEKKVIKSNDYSYRNASAGGKLSALRTG